jgi:hypothetical protein
MRLLRSVGLEVRVSVRREPRRRCAADVLSAVRCPRCGGDLVARVARGRPAFWCRCPVRRGLAIGA